MKHHSKITFTLLALAAIFIFSNCSAIGFLIGSGVDSGHSRVVKSPVTAYREIPKNSRIQVFFKDGEIREGRFKACMPDPVDPLQISHLSMTAKKANVTIPVEVIDHVAILKTRNETKYIGLGAGFVLDALVVLYLIATGGD